MADGEWYYCLDHRAVEPYDGCPSDSRLGPYATREDAQQALLHAQERNEQWETDPTFNDEPDDPEEEDLEGWGPFKH